ncbi:MAG TPA: peptidylprolyl isomerase [Dehalococcoidales bacterium]|nr:peptidylprolyl isomerase [Dehalococcoidales bacterium]
MLGNKRLILLAGLIVIIAALAALSCGGSGSPAAVTTLPTATGEKVMKWNTPPKMTIDKDKKYTATIQTVKGDLVLELFAKDVPVTVNNFVFLATQGFYDGSTFHRVIPGFMAQGGDPTGTGMGGPGYKFNNEITSHKHVAGAISMANAGPNTNGSQFFICYAAQPYLDGSYSVFGQLTQGMDVLNKITPRDPEKNPTFTGDKINKVTITVQ